MTIKNQTLSALKWNFFDKSFTLGISFLFSIILARILEPREFGLIAMVSIFIAMATVFVDSGFGSALIQKKDADDGHYNSIFYFNSFVGLISFLVFFLYRPSLQTFITNPS